MALQFLTHSIGVLSWGRTAGHCAPLAGWCCAPSSRPGPPERRYCWSEQVDCPLPPLPASLPMTLPSMTGLMMKMTMMMMTMMMMTMMMMMMMMMLMMMTMMTMMMMTMMLMY
jgi:hypothetical protein